MRETNKKIRPLNRLWLGLLLLAALIAQPQAANAEKKMGTPSPEKAPEELAIASPLATKSLLLAVAKANGRLIAVGNWGHIILSDDGGETWRQAKKVPTRTTLTSVYFADNKNGWAAGHDTVVLHTADGGETWEMQYSDPPAETPLLTIWFENAEHGIAAGSFSFMIETFDGGKTWARRTLLAEEPEESDQPHLNQFFWGPDGKTQLFLGAEAGHVYRSSDAGKTWEEIPVPYDGSIWGGLSIKNNRVLALGMRGNLFRSDDLGTTWEEVEIDTDQSLASGVQMSDGRLILVGLGGVVLVSEDNADSFKVIIRESRSGQSAVAEASKGDIAIFGDSGVERFSANPSTAAATK